MKVGYDDVHDEVFLLVFMVILIRGNYDGNWVDVQHGDTSYNINIFRISWYLIQINKLYDIWYDINSNIIGYIMHKAIITYSLLKLSLLQSLFTLVTEWPGWIIMIRSKFGCSSHFIMKRQWVCVACSSWISVSLAVKG